MSRLATAFELFDQYNKQDPRVLSWNGTNYPTEYFFALQLHHWVNSLAPQASETLLLASRCQHIGRWEIARTAYPQNKAGYLTWRKELARFHAKIAIELLQQAGYSEAEMEAVQHIILKEGIKSDPDVQVMEDALCLIFLQFQYEDFLQQHEESKVIRILQKSWGKMSEEGRAAALGLSYSERGTQLLTAALSGKQ